mmetsp:Transcript_61035/g.145429  ORF Transcript_61035/g.145429 Transcript_61035/m.145429 type:complete len:478 (-) Transcript_61035:160-1593(-)
MGQVKSCSASSCGRGKIGAQVEELAVAQEEIDRLHQIFNECDKDGSGFLDVKELGLALQMDSEMAREYGLEKIINPDEAELARLFNAMDTNGDHTLDREEFIFHMLNYIRAQRLLADKPKARAGAGLGLPRASKPAPSDPMLRDSRLRLEVSEQNDISLWDINYWQLSQSDALMLVLQALTNWGCLGEVNASQVTVSCFFAEVRAAYNEQPYHNFRHALATVHYAYKLAQDSGLAKHIDSLDLFSLVIGALCHDIDHRGRNTAFEVMTMSELAIRYNDRSPLENHHAARAFQIALGSKPGSSSDSQCNVFRNLDRDAFQTVRKRMIDGILSTDMKFHSEKVKCLESKKSVEELLQDATFVVEILMHAADIGNPMMPEENAIQWARCLNSEFTAQVEEERKLGLPVTAMMDGLSDPLKAAKGQIGFIDFVIIPMTKPLFELLPDLADAQDFLSKNRERNDRIQQKALKAKRNTYAVAA